MARLIDSGIRRCGQHLVPSIGHNIELLKLCYVLLISGPVQRGRFCRESCHTREIHTASQPLLASRDVIQPIGYEFYANKTEHVMSVRLLANRVKCYANKLHQRVFDSVWFFCFINKLTVIRLGQTNENAYCTCCIENMQ